MNDTLRILLLEDRPVDAELITNELDKQGFRFEAKRVMTEPDFLKQLTTFSPDLILADHGLPAYDGLTALTAVRKLHPRIPFIFVSGTLGEEAAIEALQNGATDYVLKHRMSRLGPAVRRALSESRQRQEREQTEAALREANQFNQQVVACAQEGIVVYGRDLKYKAWNPYMERLTGCRAADVLGKDPEVLFPALRAAGLLRSLERALEGETASIEFPFSTDAIGATSWWADTSGPLRDSKGDVIGVIGTVRDITQQKRAEEALHTNEAELEAIYDSTPIMVCLVSKDRETQRINHAMADFLSLPTTDVTGQQPGKLLGCFHPLNDHGSGPLGESCLVRRAFEETLLTGQPRGQVECHMILNRGGTRREARVSGSTALVRVHGEPKVILCLEDITARKQLELQFFQAQKMEAIGQLAGGIAHDFNNVLAASLLHLGLLQHQKLDSNMHVSLGELQQEIQRAASLTRQLLLFSRRHVLQSRRVHLDELIQELLKMLKRVLGENIKTTFVPHHGPLFVDADPGMLEQVVMNLCVNARDAMPKGGDLVLRVQQVTLQEQDARRHPAARAGDFACLEVADSGSGMEASTLKRIFEPFFTTKEAGKGTGLGLATVHGIVSLHRGWSEVESTVGQGTTFRLFLPLAKASAPAVVETSKVRVPGGTEVILLVEDDKQVRQTASSTLRRLGYEVLEASNGVEAIRIWEAHGDRVRLVFTDMVMPEGLTGLDLAERLWQSRPSLKVVISSGYSADLLDQNGPLPAGLKFLPKPYGPSALARMVRDCLDENGGQGKSERKPREETDGMRCCPG